MAALALVVAVALSAVSWLAGSSSPASAQDCDPPDPCPSVTLTTPDDTTPTSAVESSSTTTQRVTSTTAAPRQSTTTVGSSRSESGGSATTTSPPDSRRNLLVPGDGTEGADLTTTTLAERRISAGGPSDGTLFLLIVAGLAVLAGVAGLLTWRYWHATLPPAARDATARPAAR